MISASLNINFSLQVENSQREAEKNYYESIILSRVARIQGNQNDEITKEKIAAELSHSLSDYKSKYQIALSNLQQSKEAFPSKMESVQKQIDKLHQKLVEIDETEINIKDRVGLHGNTLINCLIEVRTFAKTLHDGASAYSPLVSILKGMLNVFVLFS